MTSGQERFDLYHSRFTCCTMVANRLKSSAIIWKRYSRWQLVSNRRRGIRKNLGIDLEPLVLSSVENWPVRWKMMNRIFYKYRPVQTDYHLSFVQEIIAERRLYVAPAMHFSDPFDGFSRSEAGTASRGILSFTEHRDNKLLWAYYGGWYRGVMIEFDLCLGTEPFSELRRVEYLPDQSLLAERLQKSDPFSKGAEFAHEGEWRLVCKMDMTHITIPDAAIASVTLGPSLDNNYKTRLQYICAQEGVRVIEYSSNGTIPMISSSSTAGSDRYKQNGRPPP